MATSVGSHGPLRWLERLALLVGLVLVSWAAVSTVRAALFERSARLAFETAVAAPPPAVTPEPPLHLTVGDVLGIVEIPRLGFSSIVVEGDSDEMLSVAVGHLPDTPLPWQSGNTALAGHRDGHFRPLKDVSIGDQITLRTRFGTFAYTIEATAIVLPTAVSVLESRDGDSLTLVTCYPFNYIGLAPRRFVVHAAANRTPSATR
jgi:sortase A